MVFIMRDDERRRVYFFGVINRVLLYYVMLYCVPLGL